MKNFATGYFVTVVAAASMFSILTPILCSSEFPTNQHLLTLSPSSQRAKQDGRLSLYLSSRCKSSLALTCRANALYALASYSNTEKASNARNSWVLTHLDFAIGLQQLGDRHLVLLQSPLHQLGAAHIDSTLHMWRVELGERPAINNKQAPRSSLDEARQALDVHCTSLCRAFLPGHDAGGLGGNPG